MKYSFRYCPKCAAPLEERALHGQIVPTCTSPQCGYEFWQNSKPCTCIVLENEKGEVLLCERAFEPEKGKLDLPGGFMNWCEHPEDAIRRELREELGVEIEIEAFLGFVVDCYDNDEVGTLNVPYCGRITEGTPIPADDVAEVHWLAPERIEKEKLAFRNNEIIIFTLFKRHREKNPR